MTQEILNSKMLNRQLSERAVTLCPTPCTLSGSGERGLPVVHV